MDKGASELLELAERHSGDQFGRIWPSDELRNFSADARKITNEAVGAFRRALAEQGGDHGA